MLACGIFCNYKAVSSELSSLFINNSLNQGGIFKSSPSIFLLHSSQLCLLLTLAHFPPCLMYGDKSVRAILGGWAVAC